ncbi:MAG: deoxyribodipyrimidine photolyase [Candidatus Eisenbacteria bacterium]
MSTPADRCRARNSAPIRPERGFVLYWMTSARRTRWNYALDHAVALAVELRKPLVILEALRIGYRWASDRIHHFVIEGMVENARRLADKPILYFPYVEPESDAGKGLLRALGGHAVAVVTDDFPGFMLPRMTAAAANELDVRLEAVDSNGLLPLAASPSDFPTAYAFRRFLQKNLLPHLDRLPRVDSLARVSLPTLGTLPAGIATRWPAADLARLLADGGTGLAKLAIDHTIKVAPEIRGGSAAAAAQLRRFLRDGLPRYDQERNEPSLEVTSGLSPYLHFGHIAAQEVFAAVMKQEQWSLDRVNPRANGSREGYWGVSRAAEGFLDQLITWRELGYAFARHRPQDEERYESLPEWARRTLGEHRGDRREPCYAREQLEAAATHDPLWNAAQTQLVREGRMHNYLRMLWGKKVLEWARTPEEALTILIDLNNRYALDGRNPNSYSGIFWIFGRYDRAWGPERPIFGKIRYMSSENTARKLDVKSYVARYQPGSLFD